MATPEQIASWKKKHWSVYGVDLQDGSVAYVRPLTRGEFNQVIAMYEDTTDREDYVVQICTLEPDLSPSLDGFPAGAISTIAEVILDISGFKDNDRATAVLEEYRKQLEDPQCQFPIIISEAFPEFPIEEIENGWPLEKTAYYLSRAEFKLKLRNGTLQLTEPQPEQSKNKRRKMSGLGASHIQGAGGE